MRTSTWVRLQASADLATSSQASLQSAVGLNINIKPTAVQDNQSAILDLNAGKKSEGRGGLASLKDQNAVLAAQQYNIIGGDTPLKMTGGTRNKDNTL